MTDIAEFKPKYLGEKTNEATVNLDLVPWKGDVCDVVLSTDEFTSHCPVTGQPDFATLTITYTPARSLVETKSWKLYLWSWRDRRAFNEAIVNEIADTFMRQVQPRRVEVVGAFKARGGVELTARAVREAE